MFEYFSDFMNDKTTFLMTVVPLVIFACVVWVSILMSTEAKRLVEKEKLEAMIQKEINKSKENVEK
ncbi:hypothetical protein [Lysinibacillus fusiformis]|uniref:hypothetical protein n=1 Tax=Lysinibacillus fusiformis TaxID=28031 RepID=UPI00187DFCB4|nr:hypothetical protein [Lysinibacillus fusiformis]MBD8523875.1 hypothetical protein [Lysinibacillus fusiformis]